MRSRRRRAEARRGLRHRIEHAQCSRPKTCRGSPPRRGGVDPVHPRAVGPRARPAPLGGAGDAYPYRTLLDPGARLATGSDAPVEELDPLAGIAAGGAPHDRRATGLAGPSSPSACATRCWAATVGPAWLEGQEERRGTLQPGRLADLVVLDRDLLACLPEQLDEVTVLATMVGGRWTHRALDGLDV